MAEKIFLIMPAFNAGSTIEKVFYRLPLKAKQRIQRYVIVNDGSTDNTDEAIKRLCNIYPNIIYLRHQNNRGYGAAEKTLLNYAVKQGADLVVLLHSDGQYSPEKIPDLLKPFDENEADMIQGSRMLQGRALQGGMPLYKFIANKCLTAIENRAFGMRMAEYHSGYMLYSKKALMSIPFNKLSDSFDFDVEMLLMAKIKGLRIKEIPIPTIYADEISYLNPIKYGFDVLSIVWKYKCGRYNCI